MSRLNHIIYRSEYKDLLIERWGDNGATEAEIDEFLLAVIGNQQMMTTGEFIDLCFGLWRENHKVDKRKEDIK